MTPEEVNRTKVGDIIYRDDGLYVLLIKKETLDKYPGKVFHTGLVLSSPEYCIFKPGEMHPSIELERHHWKPLLDLTTDEHCSSETT